MTRFLLATLAAVSLVVDTNAFAQPRTRTQSAVDLSTALESATRMVSPSVVQIFTTAFTPTSQPFGRPSDLVAPERASGSGVIVDATGFIVTNAHVVRGAQELRVEVPILPTGRSILSVQSRIVNATLVGVDLETDLAVIKIDGQQLPALPFGDSDELRAGQLVLAVGSPLGFRNSVSLGVVSAVARQLEPESSMIYVQTDAAINSGSSGGPLVDMQGRIVGINTLLVAQSGGNERLSFAAPSNIVRTIYEQIRKDGRVRRGDIGIRAQTITPALARGLGLARETGVVLADVLPNSPAAVAGLKPGDVVVGLNDKPMENGRQLQIGLYRHLSGGAVSLDIALAGGGTRSVAVRVVERRDGLQNLMPADPRSNLVPRLGLLGIDLNPQVAASVPVLRVEAGVLVLSMQRDVINARDGGLQPGDVIYGINKAAVRNLADLRTALDSLKAGDAIALHLERRGELMFLAFTLE